MGKILSLILETWGELNMFVQIPKLIFPRRIPPMVNPKIYFLGGGNILLSWKKLNCFLGGPCDIQRFFEPTFVFFDV